jgi:peptidyl-prolyl cis-trans isomerase-like 1
MNPNELENVILETTMGTITLELYWNHAPKSCKNFVELTRKGYYDNTIFHRVIRDFMIQGGDPTGTGKGGESIYGKYFEDEITRELKHTGAGILSMANAGKNTNGSQFFITLAPCPWLDGKHTIFGRVMHGMQVVKRIGNVQTNPGDKPLEDIKIVKGKVVIGDPLEQIIDENK